MKSYLFSATHMGYIYNSIEITIRSRPILSLIPSLPPSPAAFYRPRKDPRCVVPANVPKTTSDSMRTDLKNQLRFGSKKARFSVSFREGTWMVYLFLWDQTVGQYTLYTMDPMDLWLLGSGSGSWQNQPLNLNIQAINLGSIESWVGWASGSPCHPGFSR